MISPGHTNGQLGMRTFAFRAQESRRDLHARTQPRTLSCTSVDADCSPSESVQDHRAWDRERTRHRLPTSHECSQLPSLVIGVLGQDSPNW